MNQRPPRAPVPGRTKIWFISLQASVFANYRALPRRAGMLISRLKGRQPNSLPSRPPPQLIPPNDFVFLGKYLLPSSLQPRWRMFVLQRQKGRPERRNETRCPPQQLHLFLRLDCWSVERRDTKSFAGAVSELFCWTVVHVYNFLPGVFCKW